MYVVTVNPPASEPLSLTDAKLYCRIDDTNSDALITANITEARQWVEKYCGIALLTQTLNIMLDRSDIDYWEGIIQLPVFPIQNVVSINTYDQQNTATLFASSNYFLSNDRIALNNDDSWPSFLRDIDAAAIQVTAGYTDATLVPAPIILAMKQLVLYYFEKRMMVNDGLSNQQATVNEEMPFSVKSQLSAYRRFFLA